MLETKSIMLSLPNRLPLLFCLTLGLLLGSCTSIEHVSLADYSARHSLELTQAPAPADAIPGELIIVEESGFYLLGLLPLRRASMEQCMDNIVRIAKKQGADGVAHLHMEFKPASFFSLSSYTFPWAATFTMTGMAYQHRREP